MRCSPELEAMIRAAEKAAQGLRADFGDKAVSITEKGPSDFVSSADLGSQEILQRELSDAFPGHELVLEEGAGLGGESLRSGRLFVDPLDGTTNFLHGIPHFAVSIALQREGSVVAGVVLNAANGELFYSDMGGGAWLGSAPPRQLRASIVQDLGNAVIGTGIPNRGGKKHAAYLASLAKVMTEVAGIRRFGSAALDLAYVAAGRFEAFFEGGLAPWDVAAGSLLVTEAGGVVSKADGSESALDDGNILAACSFQIRDTLIEKLAPLYPGSRSFR